jgi:inosine/xanthosine triphosphatase
VSAARALAAVERVRVGSLNEPKLEAVRSALAPYTSPGLSIEGVSVPSGVSEQPVGYEEIAAGARNRARAAFEGSGESSGCDLAVGIEDGLVELCVDAGASEVMNVGCAVVTDGARESLGFSSGFAYPPDCAGPALRDRTPIGDLFDRYWARHRGSASAGPGGDGSAKPEDALPSARTSGNIGKLTLGVLERSDYGRHAVLCALVRFLNPSLYPLPTARPPDSESA